MGMRTATSLRNLIARVLPPAACLIIRLKAIANTGAVTEPVSYPSDLISPSQPFVPWRCAALRTVTW